MMTDQAPDSAREDDRAEPTTASGATADSEPDTPDATDADVRVVDRRWWARSGDAEKADSVRSDKPSYVAELEKQLADKDAQLTTYAAKYRAAAGEFEETRVRLRREIGKDVEREKRGVLATFLDIVDNLERAIDAARSSADDNPTAGRLVEGVELVRQQCLSTLQGFGVTPILATGQPFDPNLHDAVSTVPVEQPSQADVVIDVIKVGYVIGDEVLRPATVTVGKLAPGPR